APGLYALELESPPARPAYLRVEFHRPGCSGNVHDTCANAEDIQLTGEQATVRGHTYCGREQYGREHCVGPSPKRFYRLDLRDRKDRVRLRAKIPPRDLGFYAAVTLLRDEGPDCDALLLQCFDSMGNGDGWPLVDSIVEPGVYFLVVEGVELGAAGEFTLEVDVSDWRTRRFSPCYGGDIEGCLYNTNDAADVCWSNPLHESCATMFTSCGLSPETQACICDSDPVCCAGTDEDAERCAPVFASCNFFCEDVRWADPFIDRSRLFSLLYDP
ncbi:MAG TPA: hypothetical protein VFQ61_12980, partial [Polyangiaceae bacterium]|nr:hypothetical protein [Polyangiaceae bacterium]